MGGQQSRLDDVAEVMFFLYIKTERSELFTEAWTKFKKTTVDTSKEEMELDGDGLPQSPALAGDEPKPGQTLLAKAQRVVPPLPPPAAADDKRGLKIERKCSLNVQDSGKSPVKPKGPPPGDSKQNIARATACKKKLIAATSTATSLIHLIDTKTGWARLNNSENKGVLARALEVLSDTTKGNAFAQSVLACDIKGLRQDSSDEQMAVDLLDFETTFEPVVTDFTKVQARIMKMRKALQ